MWGVTGTFVRINSLPKIRHWLDRPVPSQKSTRSATFPPRMRIFQLPASGLPPPLCPTLVPQCSKVNYTSIPLVLEVLERFPPSGLWSGSTRARAEAGRVRTGCRTSRTGQTHARYNQSQSRFTNVFFTHNHIHPCASSNACKSCIGHSRLSGCS